MEYIYDSPIKIVNKLNDKIDTYIEDKITYILEVECGIEADRDRIIDIFKRDRPIDTKFIDGVEHCSNCNTKLNSETRGRKVIFCYNCGQRIQRYWGGANNGEY